MREAPLGGAPVQTGVPDPRVGSQSVTTSPYPHPSSPASTAVMKGNRKRDTKPERALRSSLHKVGLRFRVDHPIAAEGGRPIRADVVFPRQRVAVFLDGCFWHSCPSHGTTPRANSAYWRPKLQRNVQRDLEVNDRLARADWTVIRVWEHDDPDQAALAIHASVERLRNASTRASR